MDRVDQLKSDKVRVLKLEINKLEKEKETLTELLSNLMDDIVELRNKTFETKEQFTAELELKQAKQAKLAYKLATAERNIIDRLEIIKALDKLSFKVDPVTGAVKPKLVLTAADVDQSTDYAYMNAAICGLEDELDQA